MKLDKWFCYGANYLKFLQNQTDVLCWLKKWLKRRIMSHDVLVNRLQVRESWPCDCRISFLIAYRIFVQNWTIPEYDYVQFCVRTWIPLLKAAEKRSSIVTAGFCEIWSSWFHSVSAIFDHGSYPKASVYHIVCGWVPGVMMELKSWYNCCLDGTVCRSLLATVYFRY